MSASPRQFSGNVFHISAVLILFILSGPKLHGATVDWNANAATSAWSTGSNWSGNTAPANSLITDIARFNHPSYLNPPNSGSTGIRGIVIGASSAPLTISGSELLVGNGGIDMSAATANLTFDQSVSVIGNQSWNVNSGTMLQISNAAVFAGTGVLTKSGAGQLILAGTTRANLRFYGSINITGGTVSATGIDSVHNASAISIASGATYQSGSFGRSGGLSGAGAFSASGTGHTFSSLSDATYSGTFGPSFSASVSFRGEGIQTFNGTSFSIASGNNQLFMSYLNGFTFAGSPSATQFSGVSPLLSGGTLTFDNSAANATRTDGKLIAVNGGGTFRVSGNQSLSTATTIASLAFADTINVLLDTLGGHLKVTVENASSGVSNELTFTNGISSFVPTLNAAGVTIDFIGTGGQLGAAGNNPRIKLANINAGNLSSNLRNGVLLNPASGRWGWALANSTDYATYNAVTGVLPLGAYTSYSAAIASDNAILNSSDTSGGRSVNTLKINGNGVLSGPSAMVTGAILLPGSNEYQISTSGTVSNGANPLYFHIPELTGKLSIISAVGSGSAAITKCGEGLLALSGGTNGTSGRITINGGVLELPNQTGANGFNVNCSFVMMSGGVLQLTGGGSRAFVPGNEPGNFNIERNGGFAARGGDLDLSLGSLSFNSVNLGNPLSPSFLIFGSHTADSRVNVTSGIGLGSGKNQRFIFIKDNPNSSTDIARISGVISESGGGFNDVVKLGPGVLELTGSNSYAGGTIVNQGELRVGANVSKSVSGPLGNSNFYVVVGSAGGDKSAALLISDNIAQNAFNMGRDVTAQGGSSGSVTFGSLDPNGVSTWSGLATLNRDVEIRSVAGGTIDFTGVIAGQGGVSTIDSGTVLVSSDSVYAGNTSVNAGIFGGTGRLRRSKIVVNSQGVLKPGTALVPGEFAVAQADFSSGGTLNVRVADGGKDMLTVSEPSLIMGGSSKLIVDLSALTNPAPATYILAQTPEWSTGAGFTTVTIINPNMLPLARGGNKVSYVTGVAGSGALVGQTVKQIVIDIGNSVTPVTLASFTAKPEGSGVVLEWNCVSEYQNAGFNLYRRALEGQSWSLVNPALIAGRITNPDAKVYSYFDWSPAGMYEYKLESVDLMGKSEAYHTLSEVVSVEWNSTYSAALTIAPESVDTAINSIAMTRSVTRAQNAQVAFAAQAPSSRASVRNLSAANSVLNDQPVAATCSFLPISQATVGVRWFSANTTRASASSYAAAKVTYKDAGVMLIPQTSMPNSYDLNRVTVQREGRPVNALAVTDAGLLVYAPGYSDDYTNKDALFLRKSTATQAGRPTHATGLFSSSMPVNVTSPASVTTDFHDVHYDYNVNYRPYTFSPWFSSKYLTSGTAQDFTLNVPQAASGPSELTATIWSLSSNDSVANDHRLQAMVNGQPAGEVTWSGGSRMMQVKFNIPSGALNSGNNTISLITPTIAGVTNQVSFLHALTVNYTRLLNGSQPFEINNDSSSARMYELYNIPAAGAWVVDARFTDRATLVPTETVTQADGSLRLRFVAASGGSGKFLVTPVGSENRPLTVAARQVKPARLNGVYLSTGPAQFASGVQPLLMRRSREGVRGTFVDQEQLFDYYNHGRFGPEGIRKAVRSLRPTYLLLVGRTTHDYLNYSGANVDPLCPAFLISTSFWAQTTSDSAFGDLGRGYPEVAVGRLPVNNSTELSGAVSHILSYKGVPASGIRVHAAADRPDGTNFGAQLDTMVRANNPGVSWQENYLDQTYASAPEVTSALNEAANGGADMLLYSGHGNAARLGATAPHILDVQKVQSWTGNAVLLQATCTANWMAKNEANYKSIAIQALTQPQGGISASIGTSTYMNPDVAASFMNQLLRNSNQTGARWGSALLRTQQWAGQQTGSSFHNDMMHTGQLFGDPAMPVFAPQTGLVEPSTPGTF